MALIITAHVKKFENNSFMRVPSLYYRNVRSRYNIIKFMEHRLQEFKLTSCVIMPTYILLRFCYFF